MIDIINRVDVFEKLNKLQQDQEPVFGHFTPQLMVEHLVFTVKFSNGEALQEAAYVEEKLNKMKAVVIYSKQELPVGFRSPVLPVEGLPNMEYKDLETAIDILRQELNLFDLYFEHNPQACPVNPIMGKLTKEEWIVFHNKHFTHHFKQFQLLS